MFFINLNFPAYGCHSLFYWLHTPLTGTLNIYADWAGTDSIFGVKHIQDFVKRETKDYLGEGVGGGKRNNWKNGDIETFYTFLLLLVLELQMY